VIITSCILSLLCSQQTTAEFAGKIDFDVSDKDVEFRRLRLGVEGHLDETFSYVFSVNNDIEKPDTSLHEILIAFDSEWGAFEVGYFKEPFGLENSHSSHLVNFLERSPATKLAADHSIGFANYFAVDERSHLSWGIYRNSITARFTNLLIGDEGVENFWHIGSSVAVRKSDEIFQGDDILLFDFESLYQHGAFTAQIEAQSLLIDESESSSFTAQMAYMLNGENHGYSMSKARFNAPESGGGTELAVRGTHVDMVEYTPGIAVIDDYAFATTYYLDDSSKLQFEIGYGSDGFSDDETTFALRYHLRW
jgi:phosphate-selective porin